MIFGNEYCDKKSRSHAILGYVLDHERKLPLNSGWRRENTQEIISNHKGTTMVKNWEN